MRNNLLLLRAAAGRATDVTGEGNEPIGAHDEVVGPEPEYEVIHKGRVAAGAACGQQVRVRVREVQVNALAGEALAEIDYVSIADAESLVELDTLEGAALASLAVRFGQTRLIDNVTLLG